MREENIPFSDDPKIRKKLLRQVSSKYFKKWKYSAAIAICQDSELRLPFPYYGWRIVVHLSCGSIREFLHIMSEIWAEMNLPIERFVEIQNVDLFRQSKAIKKASKSHFNTLNPEPILYNVKEEAEMTSPGMILVKYPSASLPSICNRFGKLFQQFQSFPSVLANPETASLKLKKEDIPDYILRFIDFAVMSGAMLKKENAEDKTLAVGLHPFFSPLFNISFRYPFYFPQNVTGKDFELIFIGTDQEVKKVVNRIIKERMLNYVKKHKPENMSEDVQMDFLKNIE